MNTLVDIFGVISKFPHSKVGVARNNQSL